MNEGKKLKNLPEIQEDSKGLESKWIAEGILMPFRTYKDRVFRMIFKEKKEFLELYNAMNGTDYKIPEDLIVTTLENAIYLGMKNDVSFLVYDQLALYEHQSTENPNMPLRNLMYVSSIYSELTKDANLYSTRLVKIPEPKFVVFYNGTEEMPEYSELRLSDAFEHCSGEMCLELKTYVLNINSGCNRELMSKCRTLQDYMIFVNKVREYSKVLRFAQAVEKAITACIAEGVLEEFLRKNRAEVLKVSIFEYNEERHMQQEREEAMNKGIEEGKIKKLIEIIKRNIDRGIKGENLADLLGEDPALIREMQNIVANNPDVDTEKVYLAVRSVITKL